jgi:hypothetical protein
MTCRAEAQQANPLTERPFEAFPSLAAFTRWSGLPHFTTLRTLTPLPQGVHFNTLPRFSSRSIGSTSGFCSTKESVAEMQCCHYKSLDAPMGLC